MDLATQRSADVSSKEAITTDGEKRQGKLARWAVVLAVGISIAVIGPPAGIAAESWRLLAIFAATIVGMIVQPLPGGAMVLLGVSALAVFQVMPIRDALAGYADPVVCLQT